MSQITLFVNGDQKNIKLNATLNDLLQELNVINQQHIAVAINNEIVPRNQFDSKLLKHQDSVEILHPVGGG